MKMHLRSLRGPWCRAGTSWWRLTIAKPAAGSCRRLRRAALSENWEELFLQSSADAVIVGRGGKEAAARANIDPAERRADQLRKLVQAAVPLIVVCPACEAIVGFEIEMIRRGYQSIIVPFIPGGFRPASDRFSGGVGFMA